MQDYTINTQNLNTIRSVHDVHTYILFEKTTYMVHWKGDFVKLTDEPTRFISRSAAKEQQTVHKRDALKIQILDCYISKLVQIGDISNNAHPTIISISVSDASNRRERMKNKCGLSE